jgi:hypothetical protein
MANIGHPVLGDKTYGIEISYEIAVSNMSPLVVLKYKKKIQRYNITRIDIEDYNIGVFVPSIINMFSDFVQHVRTEKLKEILKYE